MFQRKSTANKPGPLEKYTGNQLAQGGWGSDSGCSQLLVLQEMMKGIALICIVLESLALMSALKLFLQLC